MIIIDGKKEAKRLLDELKLKVSSKLKKPALAVILANDNPASSVYVNNKEKKSLELGFESYVYRFDKNVRNS